ncbi:MBL fold metallo-hydrolase [Amycolatopsis sp. MEPSY49]|uniref:MBL fold metallo-hydrolase n=1 Tax=Amycolatopsis sp. MEPSY49 TaxID=3151600 RepID=UPI003EF35A55
MSTTTLAVTRIAHACQLIEFGDLRVLTDPWFTQSATYYQGEKLALPVTSLGRLDAIVITHEHYDHCDLDALAGAGFSPDIPIVGPGTVTAIAKDKGFRTLHTIEAWETAVVGDLAIAKDKGFRTLHTIEAWETAVVGDLTVTATPGKHGVHEVTFVIQAGGRTVFFGGDSLRVPELDRIPDRLGPVDLAILPINGLCIRPVNLAQVVMDAEQAAELTAVLRPKLAVPHHYAFHSGWLGDRMITKGDQDPRHYADAVARLAPDVDVRIVLPGTRVAIAA